MDEEKTALKLSAWIKEKVAAAGCRGVVLGMSGGVDSSVLAALCRQALPQNTLGVIMPCHSIPADKEHAELVAARFSIPTQTVVLDAVYDNLVEAASGLPSDETVARLARANLKARLRMTTLYFIANQLGYLVAGSSNRDEITVGYFTKYGDSGVDIMPMGSLVKSQAFALARFLGIPREIIEKPPSAGLWEGQTDEADMGFSYEVLDRYILTGDAPAGLKKRIEAMRASARHKCETPPIAPL